MKYFIADIHADHAAVLQGPRGEAFDTIQDWQNHIFSEINRKLTRSDDLFILGDFANKNLARWRNQIRISNVWLIKGNHDPSDSSCRAVFGNKFRHTYMTKVCGHPTWLSHYAHAFWPMSHKGAYHLYGHNHDQREDTLDEMMPERRSMDVSPESAYRLTGEWVPLSEVDIEALLSLRAGHDFREFYYKKHGIYDQSRKE